MSVARRILTVVTTAALIAGCTDPTGMTPREAIGPRFGKVSTTLSVTATSPSQATLDTTLDVTVSGSGFDSGSQAQWLLSGNSDPRVRTNSTHFVSSTSLVANITIAKDAIPSSYDVAVTTTTGKKGIGTELFTVLPMQEMSSPAGSSNAWSAAANGDVVGARAGGCNSSMLPVIWPGAGAPVDLPLIAPWCNGIANFVNSSGVMVGRLNLGTNSTVPVRWLPSGSGGYTVEAMGLLPDGSSPDLMGMNDSGYVVGNHNGAPGSRPYWWSRESGWSPITIVTGATDCYANAINSVGEISGSCAIGGVLSAVFWSSRFASPTLLPRLPGSSLRFSAMGMNNLGVVVGQGYSNAKGNQGGYTGIRWTRTGSAWSIETLPGLSAGGSQPRTVNDAGWIVGTGWVGTDKNHAFVIAPGQAIRDLGSLGTESWVMGMSPGASGSPLVAGVSNVGTVKRATIWRP
jgi:probable HAF family extracellular repeat protein